jgi:hypothetical protein
MKSVETGPFAANSALASSNFFLKPSNGRILPLPEGTRYAVHFECRNWFQEISELLSKYRMYILNNYASSGLWHAGSVL